MKDTCIYKSIVLAASSPQCYILKRLSLQLWTFFEIFYFLFKSFVKVELSYVFTINLFTIAENCTEKWIIL